MEFHHAETSEEEDEMAASREGDTVVVPFTRDHKKTGRNELCPCGSGKKFKHCHGSLN
jgi:preprotein translocase subunit SecA